MITLHSNCCKLAILPLDLVSILTCIIKPHILLQQMLYRCCNWDDSGREWWIYSNSMNWDGNVLHNIVHIVVKHREFAGHCLTFRASLQCCIFSTEVVFEIQCIPSTRAVTTYTICSFWFLLHDFLVQFDNMHSCCAVYSNPVICMYNPFTIGDKSSTLCISAEMVVAIYTVETDVDVHSI